MNILRHAIRVISDRKTILICLIVILFSIILLELGVIKYKNETRQLDNFLKYENQRIMKSIYAINHGLKGLQVFKFISKPSALSSLFYSSTPYNVLLFYIDNTGVMLDKCEKFGQNNFKNKSAKSIDFSCYVITILSLLSMMLGFFKFRDIKNVKFLFNFARLKSIYIQLKLAKMMIISINVFVLLCLTFLIFFLNGISLSPKETINIFIYYGCILLILFFFMAVGNTISRRTKTVFNGVIIIFLFWISFLFLIPEVIHELFNSNNDNCELSNCNSQKAVILSDYENKVFEKAKKFKTYSEREQGIREMNFLYINQELKKIKKLENHMISNTKKLYKKNSLYKIFIPTTFYYSMINEISSMGFESFIDMYSEVNERHTKIVTNYIKSNLSHIDPLYKLETKLPIYFNTGLIVILIFMLASFVLSYYAFKKSVFQKISEDFSDVKIHLNEKDYILLKTGSKGEVFSNKLFNACFSADNFEGNITLDNKNITDLHCFYLPKLQSKVKHLALLSGSINEDFKNKAFSNLSFTDLLKLFPQLKESELLIIDNIDTSHNIEPDTNSNTVCIELNSEIVNRKNTQFYIIKADDNNKFHVNVHINER